MHFRYKYSWYTCLNKYLLVIFVTAVVVRYLTKRYIGEYSSTGGKCTQVFFIYIWQYIFKQQN